MSDADDEFSLAESLECDGYDMRTDRDLGSDRSRVASALSLSRDNPERTSCHTV
jgi:hypothetical protein